jgi:hypothetical protein
MSHRVISCVVALLLISTPVLSAELSYTDHEPFTNLYIGSAGILVLSGEIIPGDYDRLLKKIFLDQDRFLVQNTIILASNGGDVAEAIKIARLLKSMFTEVQVGPLTGRCVSACFLIFAAANERITDGEGLIGIHRPYIVDTQLASLSPTEAAIVENKILKQARGYLQENDVPTYLVEEMFRRSSNDVYWLSEHDVENLGFRPPAADQYLVAKCGWNDVIEREAYKGHRSFEDLTEMWACRARVMRPAAQRAVQQAMSEWTDRYLRSLK